MPVLPRNTPNFDTIRIADQPLPTQFVLALRTDWNNLYDLRDYLLNLFVDDETPAGPKNGTNKNFTLAGSPQPPQSLQLYRNGFQLVYGVDYVLTGNNLVLATAPASTDTLVAYYRERGTPSTLQGTAASTFSGGPPPTGGGGGGGGGGGFWTLTGNLLYPTTISNTVLAGFTSTDSALLANGQFVGGSLLLISAATNAHVFGFFIGGGVALIQSTHSGSGTTSPIEFQMDSTVNATVTVAGQWVFGGTSTDIPLGAVGNIICYQAIYAASAPTNSNYLAIDSIAGGASNIISGSSGTGITQPIRIVMTAAEIARFTTGGILYIGGGNTSVFFGNTGPGLVVVGGSVASITAPSNASVFYMEARSGVACQMISGQDGTGTILPFTWNSNVTEQMRLTTAGTFIVGSATSTFFNNAGDIAAAHYIGCQSSATGNDNMLFLYSGGPSAQIIEQSTGTAILQPLEIVMGSTQVARFTANGTLVVTASLASSGLYDSVGGIISVAGLVAVTTAINNASGLYMNFASGVAYITSTSFGTGTVAPIAFRMVGTEVCRITTGGTTSQFLFQRTASAGIGATMQLSGNFEANALNNAFGFDGTTAPATSAAVLVYQTLQVHSTGSTTSSFLGFQCDNSANLSQIISGAQSTGTLLPLIFLVGGGERMRILTTGQIVMNRTTADSSNGLLMIQSVNNFGISVTVAGSNTSLFSVDTAGNFGSIGLSDTAGANSMTIAAGAVGSITIASTNHAFVDGETFTTSGGTRTIRHGFVCVN